MIYVGYKTIDPCARSVRPAGQLRSLPGGVWLRLGIGLLVAMKLAGREEWLLKAGQAAYEHAEPATPASEDHRGVLPAVLRSEPIEE